MEQVPKSEIRVHVSRQLAVSVQRDGRGDTEVSVCEDHLLVVKKKKIYGLKLALIMWPIWKECRSQRSREEEQCRGEKRRGEERRAVEWSGAKWGGVE